MLKLFKFKIIFDYHHSNSDSFPLHIHSPAGTHLSAVRLFCSSRFLYLPVKSSAQSQRPPERPSVRPVSYEGRSVFITSVKAAPLSLSSQPLWRAAAAVLSNLDVISVTCSEYIAFWPDTERYHLSVIAWPKRCQAASKVLSHATWSCSSNSTYVLWIISLPR